MTQEHEPKQASSPVELEANTAPVEAEEVAPKHQLTKDKYLIRACELLLSVDDTLYQQIYNSAIIIFVLLMCSWGAQWASIILPYWRGDKYHTGGLFQICGNTDFRFDNETTNIYPGETYAWRCDSFEDYVDRFQSIFPDKNSDWYVQAGAAKKLIIVSRWFESLTTSFDMVFGVTTIWAVVYPAVDKTVRKQNMRFALIGVLLTPSFAIIDTFVQNSYWEAIGVGTFNTDIQTFFYASGDIAWISTFMDFCLQLGFLIIGVRRQYVLAQQGDEVAMRANDA
ncbi:UNVERIFIED_CONTAM: hypothetical protein HDU68_005164 [Siphonaria sp. JEL0065]|nr:hypothetical protein HDU68_005164 [Siphonaria sp. JEL0065]